MGLPGIVDGLIVAAILAILGVGWRTVKSYRDRFIQLEATLEAEKVKLQGLNDSFVNLLETTIKDDYVRTHVGQIHPELEGRIQQLEQQVAALNAEMDGNLSELREAVRMPPISTYPRAEQLAQDLVKQRGTGGTPFSSESERLNHPF